MIGPMIADQPGIQGTRASVFGGTCLLIHEQHDGYMYIRLVDLGGFGQFARYRYDGLRAE